MRHYDFDTIYHVVKRHTDTGLTPTQFYASLIAGKDPRWTAEVNQCVAEKFWLDDRRPYYLVYPGVIPAFLRLNLDIDGEHIRSPMRCLLVRLPEHRIEELEFEDKGKTYNVRCVMMVNANIGGTHGLTLWIDYGERTGPIPVLTYRNFQCLPGLSVEQSIADLPIHDSANLGVQMAEGVVRNVCKLCCALCLLKEDPELIEPDVCNDDFDKWLKSGDQKYVDKAVRRGKVGWVIGRKIEVGPHVRNPHMAHVWYGPGKKEVKVIMRKGSVIHRDLIERLPTDFEG